MLIILLQIWLLLNIQTLFRWALLYRATAFSTRGSASVQSLVHLDDKANRYYSMRLPITLTFLSILQMHWDFDMYIRNRVDTSPSPVSWSSMCKQLFGFLGFMLFMFYLGEKFPSYQPVVSTDQCQDLFFELHTIFRGFKIT